MSTMYSSHEPQIIAGTKTFYVESEDELAMLPTHDADGTGDFINMKKAPLGSTTYMLKEDGLDMYMLRSTGWVKI